MAARAGSKQTQLLKALLGRLTDTLQAVKRIKATGREGALADLLASQSRRLNRQLNGTAVNLLDLVSKTGRFQHLSR